MVSSKLQDPGTMQSMQAASSELCRWDSDPCLYPTSKSSDLLSKVKAALKENYKMTHLGELSWCHGTQVAQCQDQGLEFSRCLRNLVCKIANLYKTPATVHFKKDCLSAGESLSEEDSQRYHSIIASLIYAMIGKRPDVGLVLSKLAKYVSRPGN